jgi:hypothetical protein
VRKGWEGNRALRALGALGKMHWVMDWICCPKSGFPLGWTFFEAAYHRVFLMLVSFYNMLDFIEVINAHGRCTLDNALQQIKI